MITYLDAQLHPGGGAELNGGAYLSHQLQAE